MEHEDGTTITMVGGDPGSHWEGIESMTAHEFFHAWNVKRIRPQHLEPVDYIQGNDTSDLWLCEGVDSTLAEYVLLRAGLTSKKQFYSRIADQINMLHERPARIFQSVEDAGREAWLEKYPDYLLPQRSISYYNKGEIVGFLLDLAIRHASGNNKSLDDFFRRLNMEFAKRGRYYRREDLLRILDDLAPEGCDFREFFRHYVSGTEEMDYATYLGYAGLTLKRESGKKPGIGFVAGADSSGSVIVQSVESDGPAARANLRPGDELLEMDGASLHAAPALSSMEFTPGREVRLRFRRAGEEKDVRFRVESPLGTTYSIEEDKNATDAARRLRKHWLQGTTSTAKGGRER